MLEQQEQAFEKQEKIKDRWLKVMSNREAN